MPPSPPFKLFIIYAREDHLALLELKAHLRPLEKRGDLTVWYDGEILPGEKWDDSIKAELETADIVLLFISKSFFNSEYIEKEELKKAFDRHRKSKATVVPVIIKPCLWDVHDEIASLQVLPKDGKAVSSWGDSDEAWMDVARGVQKIVEVKVAAYEEFLAKEDVKQALVFYKEYKVQEAYRILSKHEGNPRLMTADAYYILAEMLFYGEGGAKQNYAEAFGHYLKAAQRKYKPACIQIGTMFQNGYGTHKNFYEAEQWYLKAEKGGDSLAQYYLGALYEEEEEGTGNMESAVIWYRKAAVQGNLKAKASLKSLGYSE